MKIYKCNLKIQKSFYSQFRTLGKLCYQLNYGNCLQLLSVETLHPWPRPSQTQLWPIQLQLRFARNKNKKIYSEFL